MWRSNACVWVVICAAVSVAIACGAPAIGSGQDLADSGAPEKAELDAGWPDGGGETADAGTAVDGGATADAGTTPDGGIASDGRLIRVLFDNTKAETAGNADWVVFGDIHQPALAHPTSEAQWPGGISAWGFELHQTRRYEVSTLPSNGRITYEDPSNWMDLSRHQVFVVPEPNIAFTAAEATAIADFVRAGGGLFIVGDHAGADRNNDGVDPVEAWNGLFDSTGNGFGIRFAADNITDSPDDNVLNDPASPILQGPFGKVRGTTYYAGATINIDPSRNASVKALLWQRGVSQSSNTRVTFAIAEYGAGRVAAIGDSSPADDGTGTGKLYYGWTDPNGSNAELFLNATAWLARDLP